MRLIYCLQDPTIHRKDLHINVPDQLRIPDHVYYNEIQLNYLIKQCTTNIPIKPINWPINRIGKSERLQYRIGIGSADY